MATARPGRGPRLASGWLLLLAALSVSTWLLAEDRLGGYTHPRYLEMLAAAHTVQAAIGVIRAEKIARGLMQLPEFDPNRTGLIGSEFTDITTTLGVLTSKRTATNPDFAAALVRILAGLPVGPGDAVVIVLSGSFVGGNIAALAAVEALGIRPVVVSSLGASMWGASDPDFNWLEIEAVLRSRRILRAKSLLSVLGGGGAVGRSMGEAGRAELLASAARHGITIVQEKPFADLMDTIVAAIVKEVGTADRIRVVVNVGGSLLALGSCPESYEFPIGLSRHPPSCSDGTPGLLMRLSERGAPTLHVLNLRRLALDYGLPYDPVPLAQVGDNPLVYGAGGLRVFGE